MPSAASAKLEKQSSSSQAETCDNNNTITPIRQALVIIEHKIRNLEKRKTKLESYRAIQLSGKELSSDQKAAVAKYGEVAQSLEFARELSKQMLHLSNVSEKEQKKQARKEAILRAQAETLKIREVLTIQNILSHFTDANVREDFLNGCNGAAKLDEDDLQVLEKFYIDILVKRQSTPEDPPFMVGAQKASEFLSLAIDGRPKQYGETTFYNIRRILHCIQESGYLDKAGKVEVTNDEIEPDQTIVENDNEMDLKDVNNETDVTDISEDNVNENVSLQITQHNATQSVDIQQFVTEAPSAAAVPAPSFPQPAIQQNQVLNSLVNPQSQLQRPILSTVVGNTNQTHVVQVPAVAVTSNSASVLHAGHFPPTTVRAVEQSYFKHQHQFLQQMRPLADVIGNTNFYFLQESELDSPDIVQGFTSNDQNATSIIKSGTLPPQSPNPGLSLASQSIVQEQQSQQQLTISQSGIQCKPVQQSVAPIPTQTFTNQSFPTIPPPSTIFPQSGATVEIPPSQQQIPVYANQPIPIPPLVAQSSGSTVENQQSETITLANQPSSVGNLISGSNLPNVSVSGLTKTKFVSSSPLGLTQQSNQLPAKDTFESIPKSQPINENQMHKKQVEDVKDRTNDKSNDWDRDEHSQKVHHTSRDDEESNQWTNDVASNSKTEWGNNFNNQNESNTWKNLQTDNYNNRNVNRSNFGSGNNRITTGRGGVLRGGGPPPNGYRGRSNNSYQQQQQSGRNSGMYFRNNDNGFQQNQNGSGYNNASKQDSTGNYIANANNVYRSRGVTVGANKQSNNARVSNSSSGPIQPRNGVNPNRTSVGMPNQANRAARNSGHVSAYGSSRQSNIQQQDINA